MTSFCGVPAAFRTCKTAFQRLSAWVHVKPNFLAFECIWLLLNVLHTKVMKKNSPQKHFFIAPPLKIRFLVPVKPANQILKRVAMKNSINYSKQNTAKAIRVIVALASLGQQTLHSLQSLCFAPCNVIYYFRQRFDIFEWKKIIVVYASNKWHILKKTHNDSSFPTHVRNIGRMG